MLKRGMLAGLLLGGLLCVVGCSGKDAAPAKTPAAGTSATPEPTKVEGEKKSEAPKPEHPTSEHPK